MKKVLILCTGNSCRSQMAEGWLRHFSEDKVQVYSAGTNPEKVNHYAVQVMRNVGIDISHHLSNNINDYIEIDFDFIITVCDNAKEKCPFFPGGNKKLHKSFLDPADAVGTDLAKIKIYTKVRDQLKEYIQGFIEQHLI